jgi:hypothetical protein
MSKRDKTKQQYRPPQGVRMVSPGDWHRLLRHLNSNQLRFIAVLLSEVHRPSIGSIPPRYRKRISRVINIRKSAQLSELLSRFCS